jgi:hypothetical protein
VVKGIHLWEIIYGFLRGINTAVEEGFFNYVTTLDGHVPQHVLGDKSGVERGSCDRVSWVLLTDCMKMSSYPAGFGGRW